VTASEPLAAYSPENGLSSSPASQDPVAEGYEVLEALGRFKAGVVHHAKRKADGLAVALKTTRTTDAELLGIAEREYSILASLDHPNVIHALDFFITPGRAVLVLEFFEGTPLDTELRVQPGRCLPEVGARHLFLQLLTAVDYLHQRRVLHRDVTAAHCQVSDDLQDLKLAEFNTAQRLSEAGSLTMTGTREYHAPEVLKGDSPSEMADIWSAGLCLHLMLVGRLPHQLDRYPSEDAFVAAVTEKQFEATGERWQDISKPCKSMLRKCLDLQITQRPAAMLLLLDEWLADNSPKFPSHQKSKALIQESDFPQRTHTSDGIEVSRLQLFPHRTHTSDGIGAPGMFELPLLDDEDSDDEDTDEFP